MTTIVRFRLQLFVAALAAFSPIRAHAQGVITGTVVDSTSGLAMTGVVVRVESLNREALTDRAGRFSLTALPAGDHEVSTRYIGFSPARTRVSVGAGQTSTLALRLSPAAIRLGELVVTATRSGQAAALNQQQNADNISNVVAADQIGRFPDANIGDALKRLPGVTVALDQGEARFGSIRGTEPRFNAVMINGERVPSAEAEVRQVQLDLIPADMVQAIEVNKTLTPEMDADAIGGSVNVVTRASASDLRVSATLGSGYNWIRDEPVLLGSAVIGSRFLDDRLGIIVSGSHYNQRFGSDDKEAVWNRTADGRAFVEEFDARRYDIQRVRRSVSAALDYRFDPNNTLSLKSIYNHRDDWENRFRTRYVLDDPEDDGSQLTEIRRQTKGGGPDARLKDARLEDQRTQSHQLSGEHLLAGRAELTWSGTIAKAREHRPDERYVEWEVGDLAIQPDYRDTQTPMFPAAPALVAPDQFGLRRIEQAESNTEDRDRNARVDLMIPLRDGDRGTRLKAGARVRDKEKLRENTWSFAEPVNEDAFARMTMFGSRDYTVKDNLAGPYSYGVFTTPGELSGFSLFDPAQFTLEDQPAEYAAGNFNATETITAGYVQIEQNVGPALRLVAGVRAERTAVEYNGYEFDIDEETVSPTSPQSRTSTEILPSLNVRWEPVPETVVRAAWTSSLARPNYFDLVPYREISRDDEELAIGNPDLETTRSMNFDLSVERYFESVGLVSAGVFHKQITDFIFEFTAFDAVDPVTGLVFRQISQPRNGAEARLTGFELALQRQLDFLPGALRYFGVFLNYTYNDSGVDGLDIEGRDTESLPLLGTAKHSGNASLSFDAPRVNFRVALNYQSESLDAGEGGYSEDAFFDRWADRRTDIDASASIQLTQRARFFIEANNLNNRPLQFYQGERGRLMQSEFYGRRIQTGLKLDW